ncbi:hypothetical protein FJU30_04890 [Affinibrenneria salicis]|uniref:Uncharacterized protein n=1 Tax=Affinibrenneria salicis TaxID=2590031 RepID=A0A5J5G3Y8_9GAMM|nr:hypothetical protein [Affinibrenneria salicis]KAA9001632.1 hypothetical protein FJU30_04890 [Affinibrenneria salicis]
MVTLENLGDEMLGAAKMSLGSKFVLVKQYWKEESEKLAVTLRMIIEASEKGEISETEAKILFNQQKVSAASVLIALEGMTQVAVQEAINTALTVVKDFVNGKLGFILL